MNGSVLSGMFVGVLALTLLVYVLRGLGIFTFLPGGTILVLFVLSCALGVAILLGRRG
ncbi:hypothetical protein KR51_00021860 [Rubidibacter lacunae KORDI 51-2]|uniref:Uncharacterized protein n=1 Tax=Rubidibacter lacunae KORDI 51-2 TaxID=582515 RepID=U5DJY1_9CHRO|nr:hypothetical protein KR51_00021860 [Rubidibacter lacunae KORDI 51-2]